MIIISKDANLLTLINVFNVEPIKQQKLLELLDQANENCFRHTPGFISANLHRSLGGTKVAMYAQWRSPEEYFAMRSNSAALPYMQRALDLARSEPGMYEVVETYLAPHVLKR